MADDRGPLIDGVYAKLSRHRGLWWDDYIALVSWAIQLVCAILISINISHGFGKYASELKLTYPQVVQMSLRGAINGSLLILAAAWSKSSFAVTLLRMTKGGLKWTIVIVMASMNGFVGGLPTVDTQKADSDLDCNPPTKTNDPMVPGTAKVVAEWKLTKLYVIFCGMRIRDLTSVLILALNDLDTDVQLSSLFFGLVPWLVLVNLQMKFKEKIGVGVAMSLGVFAAATGIVKTIKLNNLRNDDFSYNGGDLQIWSIVEISMNLTAASIPALRPFLRDSISSVGRYISAEASDVRTDPYYGRRKSQATTSTNTDPSPPRAAPTAI
ncbi:hypothetical protein PG994_006792 [Apiospora phragmitis]|uniref:Rhodopsin domain-containing protein n=1 Tax=Apiospora phragmitis TaxID=2905665 RepID=A0ABR1VIR2_9PEZI